MEISIVLVMCFLIGIALLTMLSQSKQSLQLTPQRFQELRARLKNEDDVRRLLPTNKILAIKNFRKETGASLLEAREAIEYMAHGCPVEKIESVFDQTAGQDDLDTEIIWNLQYKSKINAIKVYRQRAHVGLKEAKKAVNLIAQRGKAAPASGGLVDPEKLQNLVFNESKIEAIKYYRQTTGVSLKEAKEAVEWLEEDLLRHDHQ